MLTINISEFRAHLLKYLEQANNGETINITTNGKHIAAIMPPVNQKQHAKAQLSALAKGAKLMDIVTPVETEWHATKL